ncbi:BTAD domain-containing putative transcriptional regulator [Amycolatopsis taiwanensis]|uniref:BTAD domain-containing putative transcriptional regulator n=1 Tax=Amycolatopsis taiwanensis TaxID=342230 RepID=UPI0004B239FC|nr:BTAD domain-containing putative transcriptional regulator [Amycolatopsis taiwanensis]
MQFHVLGPLEVRTPHGTLLEPRATKPAALLAVLLLHANAWVSIDQLIEGIWHEQVVPASAVRNLRSYVCRLRRELGDRLEGRPGGYRIRVLPGELDTDRLETLASSARTAMTDGAHAIAAERLFAALALWRGRPFDGFAFAATTASTLDETRCELTCLLAEAYLALGRVAEATALLRDLTEHNPLSEGAWARLVRALHQAGKPAEALATYDQAKAVLLRELDVEPGPELVAAHRKVLGNRTLGLVPGSVTGIDALLASATSEILVMSAGANSWPLEAIRRIGRGNLRNGVRYRVLCPDAVRLSGPLNSLSLAGADVRTDAEVPMEALVIDGTAVVLPADGSAGATIFRSPGVVTATAGLFERVWQAAVPLIPADLSRADDEVLTHRERDLLALLCSGSTDESAAVKLGISVRTVRRMVADIMNRLGARSRFQAGVKAVDRGWLLEKAS